MKCNTKGVGMKTTRNIFLSLLLLVILLFSAYFLGKKVGAIQEKPKITSEALQEQIEKVKELTTSKYHYTNMAAFENQSELYGIKIPLTQKKFILSYDGMIFAGLDLSDIDINYNSEKIVVSLPKIKILAHEIDDNSIKIFDEKSSIFNPIKILDYSNLHNDQKKLMEEKAIARGLFEEADKNAKSVIKEVLLLNFEEENKPDVIFIDKE